MTAIRVHSRDFGKIRMGKPKAPATPPIHPAARMKLGLGGVKPIAGTGAGRAVRAIPAGRFHRGIGRSAVAGWIHSVFDGLAANVVQPPGNDSRRRATARSPELHVAPASAWGEGKSPD